MASAFNVVRYLLKPGCEEEFLRLQRDAGEKISGSIRFVLIKTGNESYCNIGEWPSKERLQQQMPALIRWLDTYRHLLQEVRVGEGLTDPVSGEVVWDTQP
jgi:hypothetical protein